MNKSGVLKAKVLNIVVFHNILWAKYKGAVFSELHKISSENNLSVVFFQIAETEKDRVSLSAVDTRYHRYPYNLIYKGAYDDKPVIVRMLKLFTICLRSYKSDLIILPGYHKPEYWTMLFAAILCRTPRAVFCDSTANDRPRSFIKGLAKRFFFSLCHGFFCYGERSKQYLMMHGVQANRIFHRVQAAALPLNYSAANILELRRLKMESSSLPIFLYVGRLSKEKNLLSLIAAFKKLQESGVNARLHFIGSGPQQVELEELVIKSLLKDKVRFLGGMSPEQLVTHYLGAAALVLPSTSEPWGLVVNEAMSYGCPVIVSDACGCVPELVVNGKSGFSFRSGDIDDMVFAMQSLLSLEANRDSMSRFSLELISMYTPKHAAMQIIHGVHQIVGN